VLPAPFSTELLPELPAGLELELFDELELDPPQAAASATDPTTREIAANLFMLGMRDLSIVGSTPRLCSRPTPGRVIWRWPDGEDVVNSNSDASVPYAPRVTRTEFQHELYEVEALVQDEARLCQHALQTVMQALRLRDVREAEAVIARDDEIDNLHVRVESSIEDLLARQAPVAVDLRLMLAVIHVNLHLERIGDQCVNIAKLSLLMGADSLPPELEQDLTAMGAQAETMIEHAMRAFGARDVAAAEQLVEMDQVVNTTNYGLARRILTSTGDAEVGLRAIVIGRCLERVGDNAVDIGERTAYLVTAEFREFTDASHPV
jgi:phosphate transport system protein